MFVLEGMSAATKSIVNIIMQKLRKQLETIPNKDKHAELHNVII